MAIIKQKDIYDDSKSAFDNLLKDLAKLNTEAEKLAKTNAKLSTSLQQVKKTSDGTEAKELVKLTNQLNTSTEKLKNTETEQAKKLTEVKIKQQELNKANKEAAKDKLGLISVYQKESQKLNKLRNEYKNLAVQNKQNTKEGKALLANLQKLDKKLKSVDNAVGQNQRSVGNYTGSLKKVGLQMLGTLGLLGGLQGAFNGLKNIIGSTAEGQIFLAKVSGATNVILSTLRDGIIDTWGEFINLSSEIINSENSMKSFGDVVTDFYEVRGKGVTIFLKSFTDLVKGDFKVAIKNFQDGFFQMALGIENITGKTDEFIEKMKAAAAFGAGIAESEKIIQLRRSKFSIQEGKDLRTIADLRQKASDKSTFSAQERQKFLEQALFLTKKLGKKNEEFANAEFKLQNAVFLRNKSNIDDEIKLNELRKKADEVAASSLKKQKLLVSELQTVKRQAASENIGSLKDREKDVVDFAKVEIEQVKSVGEVKIETEKEIQDNLNSIVKDAYDTRQQIELEKTQEIEAAKYAIKEQAEKSFVGLASDIFSAYQDDKINKAKSSSDAQKKIAQQELDDGEISKAEFTQKIAAIDADYRRKAAIADKKKAIFDIAIATGLAVAKAGFITPAAIAIAIVGAIQAAAIAAKPIPQFEKGKVNIKGLSHKDGGINANIEGGESVINKQATSKSEGILNMVNDGLLTDKKLFSIQKNGGNVLANLLNTSNKTQEEMLTALLNGGHTITRNGITEYHKNDGSIEKFLS